MKYVLVGILLIISGCASSPQQGDECIQNGDGAFVVERTRRENARAFSDGGEPEDVNLELGRQVATLRRELEEARSTKHEQKIREVQVFCFGTRPNPDEQLWITPLDDPQQNSMVISLIPLLNAKADACGFYQLVPSLQLAEGRYQIDNYRNNSFAYQVAASMRVGETHETLMVVTPRGRRFQVPSDCSCIILMPGGYSIERIVRTRKSG